MKVNDIRFARYESITRGCSYCGKEVSTKMDFFGPGTEYTLEDLTPQYHPECEKAISDERSEE